MNFKTTIILLVLLAVVGGYLFIVGRPEPMDDDPPAPAAAQGTPVFTSDAIPVDAVTTVTIQRDGETIELTKEQGNWWQTRPVRFALNTFTAGREIVDAVADLRYTSKAKPGEDQFPALAEMQLDPPLATVTLHVDGDKPAKHVVKLGRVVGVCGYAIIDDREEVYFVDSRLHELAVRGKVSDWRNKSLNMPTEGNAQRIVLTQHEQPIDLAKDGTAWSLQGDHVGRADRETVRKLLEGLNQIGIDKFAADNPGDMGVYGLAPAELRVSVHAPRLDDAGDASGVKVRTLAIGRAADLAEQSYFATILDDGEPSGVVFTISAEGRRRLLLNADDVRDPRIVTASAGDLSSATLERPAIGNIELQRGTAGWAFAKPGPGFDADHDAVATLIDALIKARASRYIVDAAGDNPLATLRLGRVSQPEPETLRFFNVDNDDDHVMVLRDDETVGYIVPRASIAQLFAPVTALRDRNVLELAADQLASLRLDRPNGTSYLFTREAAEGEKSATWRMVDHERFEEPALKQLLASLLPLRIEQWLVEGETPGAGYVLTLTTTEGEEHQIVIDPATRAAKATSISEVPFQISEELLAKLGEEYRHRTVIGHSLDQLDMVKLTYQDQVLTVLREGARYAAGPERVPAGDEPIDQQKAGGLFDALVGLRALRYLAPVAEDDPRDALRTITVTTVEGESLTLNLDAANERAFIEGADEWFALEHATLDKLIALLPGDDHKHE